jgi:hypothetical protein
MGYTPQILRLPMNSSVHRMMNERRETGAPYAPAGSLRCECECHRAECGKSFEITRIDYEAVRAGPRQFVVAPDHQLAEDLLVLLTPTYRVIEKVGDSGRVAQALDPR